MCLKLAGLLACSTLLCLPIRLRRTVAYEESEVLYERGAKTPDSYRDGINLQLREQLQIC